MSSITPELELPILTIDKAHWQTQSIAGSEPLEYNIASGKGFINLHKGVRIHGCLIKADSLRPTSFRSSWARIKCMPWHLSLEWTSTPSTLPTWYRFMAHSHSAVFYRSEIDHRRRVPFTTWQGNRPTQIHHTLGWRGQCGVNKNG